jgi:hypothetical protein
MRSSLLLNKCVVNMIISSSVQIGKLDWYFLWKASQIQFDFLGRFFIIVELALPGSLNNNYILIGVL